MHTNNICLSPNGHRLSMVGPSPVTSPQPVSPYKAHCGVHLETKGQSPQLWGGAVLRPSAGRHTVNFKFAVGGRDRRHILNVAFPDAAEMAAAFVNLPGACVNFTVHLTSPRHFPVRAVQACLFRWLHRSFDTGTGSTRQSLNRVRIQDDFLPAGRVYTVLA